VFRAGRAQVLGALAEKHPLFHTPYAQERWEAPARANLERELAELTGLVP
jgi:predicted metal-dependent HD superfamily phosphohydrolase